MKAILEFDLDDATDIEAHMRCVNALDLAALAYNLKCYKKKLYDLDDDETLKVSDVRRELDYILSGLKTHIHAMYS